MPTPDDVAPPETLGLVLQEARLAMIDPDTGEPMTQAKLADILMITRWTLNRVENGHAQLQTAWVPMLPMPIREPVVRFLQRRHDEQWSVLDSWLSQPTSTPAPAPVRIRRPTGAARVAA